jgi:hypothetical protein
MAQLETDGKGNVILKPVTGWAVGHLGEVAALLKIDYSNAETDTASRSIQFSLTPQVCLRIAEALTKQAQLLLQDKLPPGKSPAVSFSRFTLLVTLPYADIAAMRRLDFAWTRGVLLNSTPLSEWHGYQPCHSPHVQKD